MYNQKDYGRAVDIPKGIVSDASNRDIGGSALYSLTPEVDYYPPNIAPDKEVAHSANFTTHANNTVFIDQERLIASRRWDLAAPLALDMNSACFKEWKKDSTNKDVCPQTSKGK